MELTKALENYRDDLVVIVAGYTELMKHFLNLTWDYNHGLIRLLILKITRQMI